MEVKSRKTVAPKRLIPELRFQLAKYKKSAPRGIVGFAVPILYLQMYVSVRNAYERAGNVIIIMI